MVGKHKKGEWEKKEARMKEKLRATKEQAHTRLACSIKFSKPAIQNHLNTTHTGMYTQACTHRHVHTGMYMQCLPADTRIILDTAVSAPTLILHS